MIRVPSSLDTSIGTSILSSIVPCFSNVYVCNYELMTHMQFLDDLSEIPINQKSKSNLELSNT